MKLTGEGKEEAMVKILMSTKIPRVEPKGIYKVELQLLQWLYLGYDKQITQTNLQRVTGSNLGTVKSVISTYRNKIEEFNNKLLGQNKSDQKTETNNMTNSSPQDQIVGNVFFTKNLDQFKTLAGNRETNLSHINKLAKSMEKIGVLMNPIIINENNEVVDGQHRLAAARMAGKGIYYIVAKDYKLKEVQALNVISKKWTAVDYIKGYSDLGYEEYTKLLEIANQFKCISMTALMVLCSLKDSDKTNLNKLYEGKFKFCKSLDETKVLLTKIKYISSINKSLTKVGFIRALHLQLNNPDFNLDYFISKLKKYPSLIQDQTNRAMWREHIEYIYNYRNKNKVSLRYFTLSDLKK